MRLSGNTDKFQREVEIISRGLSFKHPPPPSPEEENDSRGDEGRSFFFSERYAKLPLALISTWRLLQGRNLEPLLLFFWRTPDRSRKSVRRRAEGIHQAKYESAERHKRR